MKHGLFITFEGSDGSGKTTISKGVFELLQKKGYPVIYTREPGGIAIAEQIREVILNPENTEMDARTEALLYAASRRQHLIEKVLPALEAGNIVICDRFVDSSLAYQGVGRELGIDEVYKINEFAIEGHLPDATIFLQISAEEGLKRIESREYKDRLDQEELSFHYKVSKGYEMIIEKFKDRMILVDATADVETVLQNAYEEVLNIVERYV